MSKLKMITDNLPLVRMLAGVSVGYFFLQVDHTVMDAVVMAAFVPVFIGKITHDLED